MEREQFSADLRAASADARPIHICAACGVVSEDVLQAIAVRDEQIAVLQDDVANAERELRSKRAQLKRARADQNALIRDDPNYDKAMDVLAHWKAVCAPAARELGGKRLDNVLARLRGRYTPEMLKQAADGYSFRPFVVNRTRAASGKPDEWYADAELIYRTASHVDTGIRIAKTELLPKARPVVSTIAEARELILDELDSRFPATSIYDPQMEWWSAVCPVCVKGLTLKIRTNSIMPWLWCEGCASDPKKIVKSLGLMS